MARYGETIMPDSLREMVSFRIRLIQIAAYRRFEAVLRGYGTAPRYFGLLKIVEANPGISQSRLAEAVMLERASLVPILDVMEREGVVRRDPSPSDRRLRCVSLTEAGAGLLAQMAPEVARHEAAMTAGIGAGDMARLIAMLDLIEANLAATPGAPQGGEGAA
ncbi:MAG: MarR family transcriptional regulator [Paracoccus sp. (in: a-proteobacteria)]|nr:MarR family transcriptional regulator [Paracoccus sp. (in: a-proteobacteria)]